MKCRHCFAELTMPFIDLGTAPPSNAYLSRAQLSAPEKWYPLRVLTCTNCWLVQTEDYAHRSEFFSDDYAYFSSVSTSWLQHSESYAATMQARFDLGPQSRVIEVAANDGYLLQFVKERGIPCLGIEPTASTAAAAREKGIEIIEDFFGAELADRLIATGLSADLTAANNVLAHVPDINDFVQGFARILKPAGVATFEFPHLMRLVADCQFDTVYHEHFSYLSLTAVRTIFERNGLTVFDVEQLTTHGGSLRVFAQRADTGARPTEKAVAEVLALEDDAGVSSAEYYHGFQERAEAVKDGLLRFLLRCREEGKSVAAYGAAAKGNTLLNFAGIRSDLLPWVVDRNPAKRDRHLPGSRIPIVDEARLRQDKPDYVLLLPWNLRSELTAQLGFIREWGGQFVMAVPTLRVE